MMYVVKKPFKSMGKFYGVGSIIVDPTAIKRFKSKVNEGKVIVVTEDNLQSVAAYIKARSGVDILPGFTKTETIDVRLPKDPKPDKPKPNEPKPNEPKPNEPKLVAKAKVVIKK
ncbi:MAG: hypothetical protein GX387_13130 [Clostridium sp.]|nr:hypothetical protein [Clostridium sp.]